MNYKRRERIERAQARKEAGPSGGKPGLRRRVKDGELTPREALVIVLHEENHSQAFVAWVSKRKK